jgi:RNA polymerase sigma-70 factor (ECF subfamily)
MCDSAEHDVTQLLRRLKEGDHNAESSLISAVYTDLRRIARQHLARERTGHTLQPTALVHETYLKLVNQTEADWKDRAHFFHVASRIMRNILVDHARSRLAEKRGGNQATIALDEAFVFLPERSEVLVALDKAIDELSRKDGRTSQVVELRFFAGLSIDEVAEVLGTSGRTVKREWKLGKAWLKARLEACGISEV